MYSFLEANYDINKLNDRFVEFTESCLTTHSKVDNSGLVLKAQEIIKQK